MRSFVRVADLHSFTRAADALGMSRAVGQHPRRRPRAAPALPAVPPHHAPRGAHRRWRRIPRALPPHPRRAGGRRRGAARHAPAAPGPPARRTCRSCSAALLLTPALPQFQARYPELQLEVQFNDRKIDLIAEEVDLVVRVGAVREPQLIARRVVTTRLVTCASPEYLRGHGVPATAPKSCAATSSSRTWARTATARTNGCSSAAPAAPAAGACRSASPSTPWRRRCRRRSAAPASCRRWTWWSPRRWWPASSGGAARVVGAGAPDLGGARSALRESPKIRVFADFASELLQQYRRRVDALLQSSLSLRALSAAGAPEAAAPAPGSAARSSPRPAAGGWPRARRPGTCVVSQRRADQVALGEIAAQPAQQVPGAAASSTPSATTFSPRLWPSSMVEVTMVTALGIRLAR